MRGKADRALTMMVSMEHHSTDENQNKAVIGDKLMYGVIDPEPGIMIQKYRPTSASMNTHTHSMLSSLTEQAARSLWVWQICRFLVKEHYSEYMTANRTALNGFHYVSLLAH